MESSEEDCYDNTDVTRELLELLKRERKKLTEAGLDVDFMIKELEDLLQKIDDGKAHIEDIKRQMVMESSKSLIGDEGPSPASTDRLDMAAKELRKDGDVEEYYKRLRRRSTTPDADSKYT